MSIEWLSLHSLYALLWLPFALLGRLLDIRHSCCFQWINIRFRYSSSFISQCWQGKTLHRLTFCMGWAWFQQANADKIIKAKVSGSRVSEEIENFGWKKTDEAIESNKGWEHDNKFDVSTGHFISAAKGWLFRWGGEDRRPENKYLSIIPMCAVNYLYYVTRSIQIYLYLVTGYQLSIC